MPEIDLRVVALEEAEGVGEGWNYPTNVASAAKIDEPYGSWDGLENHVKYADTLVDTGPKRARLRATFEELPPVRKIDSVTLIARFRRAGGSYIGADVRPFLWVGGSERYLDPADWLTPTDYAALALTPGGGWVRAPFVPLVVALTWLQNPDGNVDWERSVINAPGFGGIWGENSDGFNGEGPFLDALLLRVAYSGAPAQLEQARSVGSLALWQRRKTVRSLNSQPIPRNVAAPLRPMGRLKVRHFAGPHENGQGWRGRPWQERQFEIREIEPRDDGTTIVSGREMHEQRVLFYDSMLLPTNVSQATEDGALRISKGGVGLYSRDGDAWSLDPGAKLMTRVAPNTKPFGPHGFESFGVYTNDVPQSAFQDLSAWPLTDGADGSTLAADTTGVIGELLGETLGWEPTSTGVVQSLLGIAATPHTADIYRTSSATPSYDADTKVGLSISWTSYVPGQPGYCALRRQFDGWYYNFADKVWQATIYWQSLLDDLGLVGTLQGAVGGRQRWCASSIDVGADATTLKVLVGLPTGLDVEDGQGTRFYDVMVSPGLLVGPPAILTAATPVTRNAGLYRVENNLGKRSVWIPQGAISCRAVAAFRGSEQETNIKRCLWYVHFDEADDNSMALYYNNGVGDFTGWTFQVRSGGVDYGAQIDTSVIGIPAGVELRLTCRWTGAHGELGVTPYTMTLFLVGMNAVGAARVIKGTDVVFTSPIETDVSYLEIGSKLNTIHFNGEVNRIRSMQWVPTDAECARLP